MQSGSLNIIVWYKENLSKICLDTKEISTTREDQRSSNQLSYSPGENLLSEFFPGQRVFFVEHQFEGVVELKKGNNGVGQKKIQSKIEACNSVYGRGTPQIYIICNNLQLTYHQGLCSLLRSGSNDQVSAFVLWSSHEWCEKNTHGLEHDAKGYFNHAEKK